MFLIRLTIFLLLPTFLLAQATPRGVQVTSSSSSTSGKSFALIIGISDYAQLPKLKYADKDAESFYNYLKNTTNPSDAGNLNLMVNTDVNRDAVVDKLYSITQAIQENDRVYIYFSGHGDMEQLIQTDNCLLLLSNSPAKNYLAKSSSYLDVNLFKEFFQAWTLKKAKVVFVCDACHSGSLIGGETGRKNTVLGLQQSWNNEIKLFSCQADELSLEGKQWGGGRGLFSYYLILGLKGLADRDKNNQVTLFELDNFLKDRVGNSSKTLQIPIASGDLKSVLSLVNTNTLAEAKKEITANTSDADLLAARGGNDDLEALIKDASLKNTYHSFKANMISGNFLVPESGSALYYFNLFKNNNGNELIVNDMRIRLMLALQKTFDQFLDFIYRDDYDKLGINEKYNIERNLNTALLLSGNNKTASNQIKAELLFMQACELTVSIVKNTVSASNFNKLNQGIDLLNQAIKLQPFAPYLYLRLGDYYLYTNKLHEAVTAYLHYQQLLPNDEYSYNKLGLAFAAIHDNQQAIAAFKKALSINNTFEKARTNLQVVMKKNGF